MRARFERAWRARLRVAHFPPKEAHSLLVGPGGGADDDLTEDDFDVPDPASEFALDEEDIAWLRHLSPAGPQRPM